MGKVQQRSVLPPSIEGARWIALTQGKFTLVDEADYAFLSAFYWSWQKRAKPSCGYAQAIVKKGSHVPVLLHRFLLGVTDSVVAIDHKDHDGLNNRRSNLRITNKSGNEGNTVKRCTNTSGYKGVFWDKSKNKWLAQLHTKERFIHLGRFTDRDEAARAYDRGAIEHFGEFAFTNFDISEYKK